MATTHGQKEASSRRKGSLSQSQHACPSLPALATGLEGQTPSRQCLVLHRAKLSSTTLALTDSSLLFLSFLSVFMCNLTLSSAGAFP